MINVSYLPKAKLYIKKKIEMCLNCIHVFPKLLTSRKITSFKLEADFDSGREDALHVGAPHLD